MGIRVNGEPGAVPDLPVVGNLVDLGEIPRHAVCGLDMTAGEGTGFVLQLLEKQNKTRTCASTSGDCMVGRGSDMI